MIFSIRPLGRRDERPRLSELCAFNQGRPRATRRPTLPRVLSVSALAIVLVATACSDSGPTGRQSSTSARNQYSPTSTTTARSAIENDAIDAYNAMWADMASAARTADYQSPRLSRHATGDALSQLSRGLYANKQHGIVAKGDPVTNPTVTSVTPSTDPTSVVISDCFDDSHWLNYVASTNELQNDTPGGRHATTATVSSSDGTWKVAELAVGAVGTC
jgi:hypothetical protein